MCVLTVTLVYHKMDVLPSAVLMEGQQRLDTA